MARKHNAAVVVAAFIMAFVFTGCGGSEASTAAGDASPSTAKKNGQANAPEAPAAETGTATFTVTGTVSLHGSLDKVKCLEINKDNYLAYGHYDTAEKKVLVSVEVPAPPPGGRPGEHQLRSH